MTAEIHDKVWRKLNPRGMTTEERRFNSREVPIPQPVGYHRAVIGYNRADQPVDEAYFDVDGKHKWDALADHRIEKLPALLDLFGQK